MGAGGSKGHVHVHLEKPFYYTGDTVTGSVVVHLEEPVDINGVTLKLSGVEQVSWTSDTGNQKQTHSDKHEIFKMQHGIIPRGRLEPGSYQVPFSFKLPAGIPGSFAFVQGHSSGYITYKAKAFVDIDGMFATDLKHSVKFNVLQKTKVAARPIEVHIEEPLNYMCCFSKGFVELTGRAATNAYLPGKPVQVAMELGNRSSAEVPKVVATIKQVVTLRTAGGRTWSTTCTRATNPLAVLSGGGLPGVVSQYAATLQLPADIEASSTSKLITNSYSLELRAETDCCLSDFGMNASLVINDPEPAAPPPPPPLPANWAPQMMPVVAVNLPPPSGYAAAAGAYGSPPPPHPMGYGAPMAPPQQPGPYGGPPAPPPPGPYGGPPGPYGGPPPPQHGGPPPPQYGGPPPQAGYPQGMPPQQPWGGQQGYPQQAPQPQGYPQGYPQQAPPQQQQQQQPGGYYARGVVAQIVPGGGDYPKM